MNLSRFTHEPMVSWRELWLWLCCSSLAKPLPIGATFPMFWKALDGGSPVISSLMCVNRYSAARRLIVNVEDLAISMKPNVRSSLMALSAVVLDTPSLSPSVLDDMALEAMQLPRGRGENEIGPAASDAHLL